MGEVDLQSDHVAPRPRILVLWTEPSGYMRACLRALATVASVTVYWGSNEGNAPYTPVPNEPYAEISFGQRPRVRELDGIIMDWRPALVLHCGWHMPAYRSIARRHRNVKHVLFFDNPWTGSLRQVAFSLCIRRLVTRWYVGSYVPGPRQARYARRLGFKASDIRTGAYSADVDQIAAEAASRTNAFAFVGRLVSDKGIPVLQKAYGMYRQSVPDPWPLHVFGVGPLQSLLEQRDGITLHGFTQPREMSAALKRYTTLVLPSLSEHWGVVVHEAAASGMSIICTANVGASVTLVEAGANGFIVPSGDIGELADALRKITQLSADERTAFGSVSQALSTRYSPNLWTRGLLAFLDRGVDTVSQLEQ